MIEVYCNGKIFKYWTAASVRRSLGNIAASFSLTVTGVDLEGGLIDIWPGDVLEIASDGVKLFRGYVRKISPSFSSNGHAISVSGWEKSCDLADCSVVGQVEWNNKDFAGIVSDICRPFGISFENIHGVDVGKPFAKFTAEPGAKAVEVISKLCKERGVLPMSNGFGMLYVFKPERAARGVDLVEGVNVLNASAEYTDEGRFSEYSVYGTGKPKTKVVATRQDEEVSRYRPLVIVDANAIQKESVDLRADWEYSTRKAKAMNVKVGVNGWRYSAGFYEPGQICTVKLPRLFIKEPVDLMISSVEFAFNGQGEQVNLNMVQPDSYAPQPEKEKAVKPVKAPKANPWATIKKAVKG